MTAVVASARKKSRRLAGPVEIAKPNIWARIVPLLELRAPWLAAALIMIGTIRIVATYPETGITFDEPGHMACGLQFLAEHVYGYETQHPPLARMLSALGPYLDGARPMGIKEQNHEGVAVMYRNTHVLRTLVLMRLGILPFFPIAGLVIYLWATRHFGKLVAVLATGMFTLLPPVLAHAGVATTDMALTTCLGAAFYALICWTETPGLRVSLVLGGATGLMVLSKFTALAFLPVATLLALGVYLARHRPGWAWLVGMARARAVWFAIAVATGALVIWAGYLFSFGRVPGWSLALPAPEVFDGVRSALRHTEAGHPAYLFGESSRTGWWYYFPVVLAVKTPVAFLALLGFGLVAGWRRRNTAIWLPLAFSLGILLPAMMGHVNIGVRHILPVYLGFSIVAALGLVQLMEWAQARRWLGALAVGLVIWMIFTGSTQHPNYLAYFNEFAGSDPSLILVDSDLDWGQDTVRLARRFEEMGVNECTFIAVNLGPADLRVWPGIPVARPLDARVPVEGWTAVSPSVNVLFYHLNGGPKPWYEYLKPVGNVGALLLYYVPPGSLGRESNVKGPVLP